MENYKKILTLLVALAVLWERTTAKPLFFDDYFGEDSPEIYDDKEDAWDSLFDNFFGSWDDWFNTNPKNCTIICINCSPNPTKPTDAPSTDSDSGKTTTETTPNTSGASTKDSTTPSVGTTTGTPTTPPSTASTGTAETTTTTAAGETTTTAPPPTTTPSTATTT